MAVPLITRGQVIGVLDIQDEKVGRFTEVDEDTMLTLAGQLATSVDTARLFEEQRESEQRFRTISDFTYAWETWLSEEGQLLYVSPSCERISGYTHDGLKRPHFDGCRGVS